MKKSWIAKGFVGLAAAALVVGSSTQAAVAQPSAGESQSVTLSATQVGAAESLNQTAAVAATANCTYRASYILGGNRFIRVPATSGLDATCLLRQGASNTGVRTLQTALNLCNGKNLVVDGVFGPATRTALIQVQARYGLVQDGIYGPNTRNRMTFPRTDGGGNFTNGCFTYAYATQFPKNNI